MIDSHCHLDLPRFDADRASVLERAWAAGVTALVVPGVAPATWEALLSLSRADPRLWVGLGVHPQFLAALPASEDEAVLCRLDSLLGRKEAVAVGECGLDGPSLAGAPLERQLRMLRGHFELARKHHLPLILHCFHAHPALLALLEDEALPDIGGVLHSYSGGVDLVKRYAAQGMSFSFAGPVSYAGSRKPLASLRAVPPERLLAETDAPDQAPTPHRGRRSEPAYVREILESMAVALGESMASVTTRTTGNARRLFQR